MDLTPLYLHSLSDREIELLRDILVSARGRYYEYSELVERTSGDLRNFLKDDGPSETETTANKEGKERRKKRPNPELVAQLYNFVLGDGVPNLRTAVSEDADPELAKKIRELHQLGISEGTRYDRDITVYMNRIVGEDIGLWNVPNHDLRYWIGYRYRTDLKKILRFLVRISPEQEIGRTTFKSYIKLERGFRLTRGFAYHAKRTANTYLSGFITNGQGCEFIALREVINQHIRSGLVITTDSEGKPSAKQCILVDITHTRFADKLTDLSQDILVPDEHGGIPEHDLLNELIPAGEEEDIGRDILDRFQRVDQIKGLLSKQLLNFPKS